MTAIINHVDLRKNSIIDQSAAYLSLGASKRYANLLYSGSNNYAYKISNNWHFLSAKSNRLDFALNRSSFTEHAAFSDR